MPGKVWVGTLNGMVGVLDAKSGQVLQSIALFPGSGGMTLQLVFDLKFDGQHVWALAASKKSAQQDTLFVIDTASGTLLKQFRQISFIPSHPSAMLLPSGVLRERTQTVGLRYRHGS
jgi:hypothetical protein